MFKTSWQHKKRWPNWSQNRSTETCCRLRQAHNLKIWARSTWAQNSAQSPQLKKACGLGKMGSTIKSLHPFQFSTQMEPCIVWAVLMSWAW